MKTLFLTSLILFIQLMASATITTGNFTRFFLDEGETREVCFYVPENYDSNTSYPLIIGLHGGGMTNSDARALLHGAAVEKEVILLCPDLNGLTTLTRIREFLDFVVPYIETKYNIDKNKRIISGFSLGGQVALQLGLLYPSRYNGAMGFSPTISSSDMTNIMWKNITSNRLAVIMGGIDSFLWNAASWSNEITNKGAKVLFLTKPGINHMDENYYNSEVFKNDFSTCLNYVLNTTAIPEKDPKIREKLKVFPNPFTTELHITFPASDNQVDVSLLDMAGQLIYQFQLTTSSEEVSYLLDTKTLVPGLYILRTKSGVHSTANILFRD